MGPLSSTNRLDRPLAGARKLPRALAIPRPRGKADNVTAADESRFKFRCALLAPTTEPEELITRFTVTRY